MTLNSGRRNENHISVRGFARQSMESRTVLEFEFEADRMDVESAGRALQVAEQA